ncbi:Fe-Mn family superoxide dismutase [Buchnera aphidicola (Chaitoregma tattakana)]|uniref:superoxide dismutase n=1 Tax=Buchnera aphidicola TaxID=9 RepID=UPI0031B87330
MFQLPSLSYSYTSLEPYIDEETMFIHYNKHHKNYLENLNNILIKNNISYSSLESLIKSINKIDIKDIQQLKNHAGGHYNHSLFWKNIKLNTNINNNFKKVIEKNFVNIKNFKNKFEKIASMHFGSGWIWLVIRNDKKLEIVSTKNQDNTLMYSNSQDSIKYPIFGLDLWEHAYYLKYKNNRIAYIKNFWKILNWDFVSKRYNNFVEKKLF